MPHQFSLPFKAALVAGTMLLGTRIGRAQMLLQVQVPGQTVIAKNVRAGTAQFALYDLRDPSHCVGVYDAAAINVPGKDTLTPADMNSVDEMKIIKSSGTQYQGKTSLNLAPYKGTPPTLGPCEVGQASSIYGGAAGGNSPAAPPVTPVPSAAAAYQAQMDASMNTVRIFDYKITKADAKKAEISITDSVHGTYKLTIELANGLQALGSSMRNSARASNDGNLESWKGKSIKVSIGGSFARYYRQDGTPEVQSEKGLGSGSVSAIMRNINGDDLKKIFDDLISQAGPDALWVNVARTLETKHSIAAAGGISDQ